MDVLRRHFQSCKQRGSSRIPSAGKRGRKRKACDACVDHRTQCDGEIPCETCLQRRSTCSLSHTKEQCGKSGCNRDEQEKPKYTNINKIPIHFLLNFSDPGTKTLYDFQQVLTGCDKGLGEDAQMPCSDNSKEPWMGLFHLFINTTELDRSNSDQCHLYGLADREELCNTISRVLRLMKPTFEPQINNRRQSTMDEAAHFFSPTNVTLFVSTFFEKSHKNSRFIHKASFNIHTISAQLLLTIVLMSATCVSPEDASTAERYSDIAENLIFDGLEFGQILNADSPLLTKANMEILQAAMLITVIQWSRHNVSIKRRIRTRRFPALVCAARALRLTQAINDTVRNPESLELDSYFHKESLVRTMSWIYLMDAHLVIYYRSPPQFKIAEACFGVPQNEELYDTMEPITWLNAPQDATGDGLTLPLKLFIQLLMDRDVGSFEGQLSRPCTFFSLFLLLGSLHCILFEFQALRTCVDVSGPLGCLDVALDRWKKMWDLSYMIVLPSDIRQSGFMVHALELWWVAKKLVQNPSGIYPETGLAVDSLSAFHEMFKALKGSDPTQRGEL
ncbi:hypothetical protein BDV26DRAFT_301237 [Aspergillus bertholletiae]|uniref:Zn(2)-C6 fungal-type domain-containing protein n=1 Tax=Aspergillus bertholletiae TaxID=1226010 RepID=A0A5N7BIN5_9EURO|nr:hypothetical protein BDV26DRAFT_301237 [Aspergillus bertholletiae]